MVAGTVEEMLPIFRGYFPEFDSISDTRILMFLTLARTIFYKCQDATIYLAAHLLVLGNSSGLGDSISTSQTIGSNQDTLPLKMAKVGTKQAEFSEYTCKNDMQYTTSNYGVIYLQLKNTCVSYKLTSGVVGGGY